MSSRWACGIIAGSLIAVTTALISAQTVPQSGSETTQELRRLAEAGNADAQMRLGVRYQRGEHELKQDGTEAVKWFRRAADQGNAGAQFLLSRMYSLGL